MQPNRRAWQGDDAVLCRRSNAGAAAQGAKPEQETRERGQKVTKKKDRKGAYMTVSDVAAVLGVSQSTVYRLLHDGELEAKVFPGMKHRRIPKASLDAYIERGNYNG